MEAGTRELVLVGAFAAAALLLGALALVLVARARAAARRDVAAARAETAALTARLDALALRTVPDAAPSEAAPPRPTAVLARPLGPDERRPAPEEVDGPVEVAATLPAPVFTDMVVRESVIRLASLTHGVRRALAPEQRHRVRLEVRREVKRSRKQRRAAAKAALREQQARDRAGVDRPADRAGARAGEDAA